MFFRNSMVFIAYSMVGYLFKIDFFLHKNDTFLINENIDLSDSNGKDTTF